VKPYGQRAVRFRKTVKQNNDPNYQPNVVGFPYRPDARVMIF
jgi:hypothetical protein